MKTIHRAELIDELARSLRGDRQGAEVAINALFGDLSSGGGDGVIAAALAKGKTVVITGFGTFTPRGHYATTIPNPNGEPVSVPSWRGVTFRAGEALKRAIQYEVRVFPVHR